MKMWVLASSSTTKLIYTYHKHELIYTTVYYDQETFNSRWAQSSAEIIDDIKADLAKHETFFSLTRLAALLYNFKIPEPP